MSNQNKKKRLKSFLGMSFFGDINVQGSMFDFHDNQNIYINGHRMKQDLMGDMEDEESEDDNEAEAVPAEESPKEELNFFAPAMALKTMLAGEWFAKCRTNSKYNKVWCERFVDDLMESECKIEIARLWRHSYRRQTLMANIVGNLKRANVIEGSNLGIAQLIVKDDMKVVKTYARYIGRCQDKDLEDWVIQYENL